MEIQFLPLELWRASSLAQETKTVIAAYDRCIASGDSVGLTALRRAIEKRIEDLEAFYIAHVDDEKSVLFEKQRLKLRKLLHEYDSVLQSTATRTPAPPPAPVDRTTNTAAPRSAPAPFPLETRVPAPQTPTSHSLSLHPSLLPRTEGVVSREIREDTRLTLDELIAWFSQGGVVEMPEVSAEIVERVFTNVTRINLDGRMSVRDLRQWYITFGKRAIRDGLLLDEIVSVGFARGAGATAVSAKKENVHKKDTLELISSGVLPTPGGFSATQTTASAAIKPLYAWEVAAAGGTPNMGSSGRLGSGRGSPGREFAPVPEAMTLPNGMLEFQVRLTPEEYNQVALRRRMLEAEEKYKDRISAAKEKAAAIRGEPAIPVPVLPEEKATPLHYAQTSLIQTGPYEEPVGRTFFYRSP